MKVLGYVRVSVDEEEGQNQSILAQKSAIERWARGNQAKIVQIFEEPGVSGTRANRPAFRRMLAKAADPAEKIDAVVVYSMSRFSRSLRHQLEAEEILEEANVQIVSITDPMGEGEDGKFRRSLAGLINEKYGHLHQPC
jgi:DNA invertase Pin-like site-specific DNA recombinase